MTKDKTTSGGIMNSRGLSLIEQLEKMTQERDDLSELRKGLDGLLEREEAQAQKYKEALKFYADPETYYRCDLSAVAREALPVESKESTTYENEAMAWVVEYSDGGEQCLNCEYSEPTDPGTGHTCMAQAPTDCPAFEDLEQDVEDKPDEN